jgi:hypothetical protein
MSLGLVLAKQILMPRTLTPCPEKFRASYNMVYQCLIDAEKHPHAGPHLAWKLTELPEGWITHPGLSDIASRRVE